MHRHIPNVLTLLNAACGVLAMVCVAREAMGLAAVWVGVALVLDFLDGFVAKLLHAQSALGVQLDSLADAITFGALPGFVMFQMLAATQGVYFHDFSQWSWAAFLHTSFALLIPMAAVMRLGLFNLDTEQRDHFLGLPVPAMTIVVMAFPVILEQQYHLNFYNPLTETMVANLGESQRWDAADYPVVRTLLTTGFYKFICVFLALAMLVRVPMISLKFKGIRRRENAWRYALLGWAVVTYLLFLIPYLGLPVSYGVLDYLIIPMFMAGYFVLSWIYATFAARKNQPIRDEI